MNYSLTKLLFFRLRGVTRQRLKQLVSIKGFFSVGIISLFVYFIGATLSGADIALPSNTTFTSSSNLHLFAPLGLLFGTVITVLTSAGPTLYFSQSEFNFLFTAPISRSALVLYKVLGYMSGAFLTALLLSIFLPATAQSHVATFISVFLSLLFVQLSSAALGMCLLVAKNKWHWMPSQKVTLIVIILATGIAYHLAWLSNPTEIYFAPLDNTLPSLLLTPVSVFTDLFLVESIFPEFSLLLLAALSVIIFLVLAIVYLDKELQVESMTQSLIAQQKWRNLVRSGILWGHSNRAPISRKTPTRLAGILPIAWIQLLRLHRCSLPTIYILIFFAVLTGSVLAANASVIPVSTRAAIVFFFAIFLLPRTLVFDFRSSLENMELLKTLPVSNWAVCLGQLLVPVVLTSFIESLMLLVAAPFISTVQFGTVLALIILTIPLNFIVYTAENLIFLLFPTRLVPVGRVDFDFLGRTLAEFMAKTLILLTAGGLTAAAGMAVYWYISRWWPLLYAVVLMTPIVIGCLLQFPTVLAYQRFDIARYNQLRHS